MKKKFCEDVIKELLDNKHIIDVPPQFFEPDIARHFIEDGLRLSLVDKQMHEKELAWLKAVTEINGIDDTWYENSVEAASNQVNGDIEDSLEVKCLEWE